MPRLVHNWPMSAHLTPRSRRNKLTTLFLRVGDDAPAEKKNKGPYTVLLPAGYRRFSMERSAKIERSAKKASQQSDAVFDAATAVRMLENPAPASSDLLDILALD